jgi:N-acyl-D-amino-acid deacylase
MAILVQKEGDRSRPGGAHLRGFSMSEEDIDRFAGRNWMATATDGSILLPGEDIGVLHPRSYGTFPRKIRRYALEHHALTLEDAIRSATSLPAQIMGIEDRGTIRTGAKADIVVFDLGLIRDVATAENIHIFSQGIDWVLVNGRETVAAGQRTGARPGLVIANPHRP